jgi:hypothetical protein
VAGPTIKARERFAATGAADASVEGAILASWIRSRLCGAGPDRREARYDGGATDRDSRLHRAARPVLERLLAEITDTPTALLLSDPEARVLHRWASEPAMARLMDRVRAAEGFVLSRGHGRDQRRRHAARGGAAGRGHRDRPLQRDLRRGVVRGRAGPPSRDRSRGGRREPDVPRRRPQPAPAPADRRRRA